MTVGVCHWTKHESKQHHLARVIAAILTEWGKPVSQHRGLILIRPNVYTIAMELLITKGRNPEHQYAHTRVLLLQSTLHATPSSQLRQGTGNATSADIKPFSTADSKCCYFCKCSTDCQQQVSCKIRGAVEGAGSGPPARTDPLKVFTPNRKD